MGPSDSPEKDAAPGTQNERAEVAQAALENLFEVSPDAIFVTDTQGVIRGANPRSTALFGHTQGRAAGNADREPGSGAFSRPSSQSSRKLQRASSRTPDGRGHEPLRPAQGWLRVSRRHHAQAGRDALRPGGAELCPRRQRTANCTGRSPPQRPAIALHRGERARLRHLPAGCRRLRDDLEPRCRAHQAVHCR